MAARTVWASFEGCDTHPVTFCYKTNPSITELLGHYSRFSIVSSTSILEALEGLGKGKEGGECPVNEDCGYLEKFAQGCAASPVAER